MFAPVDREGRARSRHVADVTAKTLRKAIVTQASRKSYLMTDEEAVYEKIGRGVFRPHGAVNHSADEYVRLGDFMHTNTVESSSRSSSALYSDNSTTSARRISLLRLDRVRSPAADD